MGTHAKYVAWEPIARGHTNWTFLDLSAGHNVAELAIAACAEQEVPAPMAPILRAFVEVLQCGSRDRG